MGTFNYGTHIHAFLIWHNQCTETMSNVYHDQKFQFNKQLQLQLLVRRRYFLTGPENLSALLRSKIDKVIS